MSGILYTNLKVFHYPEKLASLPAECPDVLPPLHIRVKPTNICNHRCYYCAYMSDTLQLGKDMKARDQIPQEKMMEFLDDVIQMGVEAVTFSGGGEPLIYPHIVPALERLAASDVYVAMLTNGSRLLGEAARLLAHHATWIRVSMDGWDARSYAEYRNVSGNEFSRVMQNLEQFQGLGGPCYLSVIIDVDETNAPHVHEMIGRLAAVGVRSVRVAPVIRSNDGQENALYHQQFFEGVNQQVERAAADFPHIEISNGYHAQLETFVKSYSWCPFLQIRPVLGADMNVYTCHDKAYNLDEGLLFSIAETRFRDAWGADKARFFRVDPSRHCGHHCVADPNNELVLEYLGADTEHLPFV